MLQFYNIELTNFYVTDFTKKKKKKSNIHLIGGWIWRIRFIIKLVCKFYVIKFVIPLTFS